MESKFNYTKMAEFLPYRDLSVCEKVRNIKREDICKHPNKNLKIRIIEDDPTFSFAFLLDIIAGIKNALDEGRQYVMILPAPCPAYAYIAEMINQLKIPCHHVHTFNMDEYADQDGNSAPREWRGGYQYWMWKDFFTQIKPEFKIPENQIHFPGSGNVNDYSKMLEDLGGADVCYGGIGWSGHLAFIEPHLAEKVNNDMDEFLKMGTMLVDLHPFTVLQNSLYSDAGGAGDWSKLPPRAYTVGPKDIAGAKKRSSWNGFGCGDSMWQRFIIRLALHGPVTPQVPASMLQILDSEIILNGKVSDNCTDKTCERLVEIKFR